VDGILSSACERNKQPILKVLCRWLPKGARVLEIGSGSGQHALFFCQQLEQLIWQTSERGDHLPQLVRGLASPEALAPGARLLPPLELEVGDGSQWPSQIFDAVFTANTLHIFPHKHLPAFLAGSAKALEAGGLLLIYGPFHQGGVHHSPSNEAFDAFLRSLDPDMGVRDALEIGEQAITVGLEPAATIPMPANNHVLIFRKATPSLSWLH